MLLPYDISTKDEDIKPASLGLRHRFAQRKLEEASENGAISDAALLELKEKSKEQMKLQFDDELSITMAKINQGVTLVRTEQQLVLDEKLRVLGRDTSRAQRLNKQKIDSLSDLEKRVNMMRRQLKAPVKPTVDAIVEESTRSSNRSRHDLLFTDCVRCNRRILKKLYDQHVVSCERLGGLMGFEAKTPIFSLDQSVDIDIKTTLPSPPRNVVVAQISSSYIDLSWDPPVLDGGLNVFDYEIRLNKRCQLFNKKTQKWKRWVEEIPARTTTLWAAQKPVCHQGARITGLEGNHEYFDISVRSRNLKGYSDWLDVVPGKNVRTDLADPPSAPMFVSSHKVTSSCIELSWSGSHYDGGSPLEEYIVHYTVVERHISSTSSSVMVPVLHRIGTGTAEPCEAGSDVCKFTIRNLEPDSDITNIHVKARNRAGMIGEGAKLVASGGVGGLEDPGEVNKKELVRTEQMGNRRLIIHHMKLAQEAVGDTIDTDFYSGVVQRLER
jgi:hypothetical protein